MALAASKLAVDGQGSKEYEQQHLTNSQQSSSAATSIPPACEQDKLEQDGRRETFEISFWKTNKELLKY